MAVSKSRIICVLAIVLLLGAIMYLSILWIGFIQTAIIYLVIGIMLGMQYVKDMGERIKELEKVRGKILLPYYVTTLIIGWIPIFIGALLIMDIHCP